MREMCLSIQWDREGDKLSNKMVKQENAEFQKKKKKENLIKKWKCNILKTKSDEEVDWMLCSFQLINVLLSCH